MPCFSVEWRDRVTGKRDKVNDAFAWLSLTAMRLSEQDDRAFFVEGRISPIQ